MTELSLQLEGIIGILSPVLWLAVTLTGTAIMAAIGWYVQLVHYPAFHLIPHDHWSSFHRNHSFFTGILVLPAMLIEGVGAFAVWMIFRNGPVASHALAGLLLAIFAIGWTFAVSSRLHNELAKQPTRSTIDQLIKTNLWRSIAWVAHLIVAIEMFRFIRY